MFFFSKITKKHENHEKSLKKDILDVQNVAFFFKKMPHWAHGSIFLLVLSMALECSEMKELGSELDDFLKENILVEYFCLWSFANANLTTQGGHFLEGFS